MAFITYALLLLIALFLGVLIWVEYHKPRPKPNPLERLFPDDSRSKTFSQSGFDPNKPISGLIRKADTDLVYLSDRIELIEEDLVGRESFEKLEEDFNSFKERFEEFRKDLLLELRFLRAEVFFKKFSENEKRQEEIKEVKKARTC